MIQSRRLWFPILIAGAILALGACGVSNLSRPTAPIKVHVTTRSGSKQPASISSVNEAVASTLRSALHLKRVIVGQAPPGTVGLQAFLDRPSTITQNALHTGEIPIGGEGWLVDDGIATLPSYSSASAEVQSISQLAQSSVATLPTSVRAQIASSKALYVDFAYGSHDQLAYAIFWWGNPAQ